MVSSSALSLANASGFDKCATSKLAPCGWRAVSDADTSLSPRHSGSGYTVDAVDTTVGSPQSLPLKKQFEVIGRRVRERQEFAGRIGSLVRRNRLRSAVCRQASYDKQLAKFNEYIAKIEMRLPAVFVEFVQDLEVTSQ